MKKNDIILIGVVVLLIIISFFAFGNKKELTATTGLTDAAVGINTIEYSTYEEILNDSQNNHIVYIGSASCSYCTKFQPIIEEVAEEYNLVVYYIDISTLTSSNKSKLSTSNSYLKDNEWGTPTTLILLGNEVVDVLSGYVEEDELVSFFSDNNLIN
ncbi:MAG: thioredoxin family protein [bacterium]|nr:thioredoxin family protein [bacterium]